MWLKRSNLLRLGTKLGIKVFSILLSNSPFDILLLSLIGWGLIVWVKLPIKAKVAYDLKRWAFRLLKSDSKLLI